MNTIFYVRTALAQLVELQAFNLKVAGSTPARGIIRCGVTVSIRPFQGLDPGSTPGIGTKVSAPFKSRQQGLHCGLEWALPTPSGSVRVG